MSRPKPRRTLDRNREPDLASSSFKADPYAHWTLLRDLAPVHSVRLRNGALAGLVSRYDDAVAVLSNPQFVKDDLEGIWKGG